MLCIVAFLSSKISASRSIDYMSSAQMHPVVQRIDRTNGMKVSTNVKWNESANSRSKTIFSTRTHPTIVKSSSSVQRSTAREQHTYFCNEDTSVSFH
jgi:hypothetical protein